MKKERAFTLIELIAVIVIIGLIVAVGIPAMSGLTRSAGLQGGVRQISNAGQLARQLAITQRKITELQIMQTSFSIFTNGVQIGKVNNLPVGVVVDNGGMTSIKFKPTGGLVGNVDQFIVVKEGTTNNMATLVATNSNLSTITFNAVLGRVTYQ
jgi:prepilin-type N-terminal cleavage/methylation domain-containing protein